MSCFLLPLFASVLVVAQDPSGGWLSYAVYATPQLTDIITKMSAVMTVPTLPVQGGGEPAFWFGVQTAKGNGALIQPIMSKYLGRGFYMFQEIYDWTDGNDEQSSPISVKPGDVVTASIQYVPTSRGYIMNMSSNGQVSNFHYNLLKAQTSTESVAYFVLEHQPLSCKQLPASGVVRWTNITIEVNNVVVPNPQWVAKQEGPKCGSEAKVVDSATVEIVWNP